MASAKVLVDIVVDKVEYEFTSVRSEIQKVTEELSGDIASSRDDMQSNLLTLEETIDEKFQKLHQYIEGLRRELMDYIDNRCSSAGD